MIRRLSGALILVAVLVAMTAALAVESGWASAIVTMLLGFALAGVVIGGIYLLVGDGS